MLNLSKIYDNKFITKTTRNFNFLKLLKLTKLKKLESLKNFYRLTNIGKFFFKCNAEFFNYKYQLFNIKFFFQIFRTVNKLENLILCNIFNKFSLFSSIFFNFFRFISRKNILIQQIEENKLNFIVSTFYKWSLNNKNNFDLLINQNLFTILKTNKPLSDLFFQQFFLFYNIYNYILMTNNLTQNKLMLINNYSHFNNITLYKLSCIYLFL